MHIDSKMSILTYNFLKKVEQLKTVMLKLGKHIPQMERMKSAQGTGHDGFLTISYISLDFFFFPESLGKDTRF